MPSRFSYPSIIRLSRRVPWRAAAVGLASAMVVWLLSLSAWMHGVDDWLFDECFFWRGLRPLETKIVIVGLDSATFKELDKPAVFISPELAEVVAFLNEQGAAAIGLDLIIPEDLSGLDGLQPEQPGDASKLGTAIESAGNVVLARWLQGEYNRPLEPLPQWRLKHLTHPEATDEAFVDTSPDSDQFIRRQLMYLDPGQDMHFALALLLRANPGVVDWSARGLFLDGETVPLDSEQHLRINFVGPPGSVPVISLRDVLLAAAGKRSLDTDLHGAIVIIGDVTRGQHDYHVTPYANRLIVRPKARDGGLMCGPELHANVLATLADRAWIITPWWLSSLPLLVVVGTGLGIGFTRLNLPSGAVVAVVYQFAWQAVAVVAFSLTGWRLPMAPLLLLGLLAYACAFGLRWNRLRRMFGVVKSSAIARVLAADPFALDLRGEDRIITVLFADIRNFTGYSEVHSPREVVTLLNTYYSAIVPIIERHGGALNQYMGDGIMVLYGAPNAQPDHAARAVRTAVDIVQCVHVLKETWKRLDCPVFRIGVGVHTGRVVVGTVGSPHRLDYTAIGDTINSAARIESETKQQGCEILISNDTYRDLPEELRQELRCEREVIMTSLKGKGERLPLHRVGAEPIVEQSVATPDIIT